MRDDPGGTEGRIVVVGASAGGLTAVSELLIELPADYPWPVVVASHSGPKSYLAEALRLRRDMRIAIETATDGMALKGGRAIVLPGATHGLVIGPRLHLSPLVRESGFRPSVDALFMTAAASYGRRAVAVVLSGTMNDGMRGAQVIYDMGGMTIVQDPADAERAEMPQNVIDADHPRRVMSAPDLGSWLAGIA